MPTFINIARDAFQENHQYDVESLTAIRFFPVGRSANHIEFFDRNGPALEADLTANPLAPAAEIIARMNAAGFEMTALPLRAAGLEYPLWVSPAAITYAVADQPYGLAQTVALRLGVEGFYDSVITGTTPEELKALQTALRRAGRNLVAIDPAATASAAGPSSLFLFDPAALEHIAEDRSGELTLCFRNSAYLTVQPAPQGTNNLSAVFQSGASGLLTLPGTKQALSFRPGDVARFTPSGDDMIRFVRKREKNAAASGDFYAVFNNAQDRDSALERLRQTFAPGNIWPARRFTV